MSLIRSHEIGYIIDNKYGVGLKFKNLDGNECVSVCDENPRRVILNLSSFVDISIGATHYYADFQIHSLGHTIIKTGEYINTFGHGDDLKPKEMLGLKIEITRKLIKEDFDDRNRFENYKIGDYTNCFNTKESANRKARKEFKRIFVKGWELVKY